MSEQITQVSPQQRRQEEPDTYVTDPAKAEVMAYASKEQEEAFVEHSSEAEAAGHNMQMPGDSDARRFGREIRLANEAREKADNQASIAGDAYDKGYEVELNPLGSASDRPKNKLRQLGRRIVNRS